MKWAGICDKGSTWEPVEHLIGDVAKTALHSFKEKRAREATALDEARKAALSGSADPGRVEDDEDKFTGNAENSVTVGVNHQLRGNTTGTSITIAS